MREEGDVNRRNEEEGDVNSTLHEHETFLKSNCMKFGLQCLCINADNLRNKLIELEHLIYIYNPDIVAVQEILPKNTTIEPEKQTFEIEGYELYVNDHNWKRGVCLYIKHGIPCNQVEIFKEYEESVWCEIKLRGSDKLLVGSVYKSPSSNADNTKKLNEMLNQVADKKPSHLLVMGDMNFPELNWKEGTSPDSLMNINTLFMEAVRDSFLHQHVTEPTHYRPGCQPSTIDLILTNEEGMVSNLEHLAPLGASHHTVLKYRFNCYFVQGGNQGPKYQYHRADFESMRNEMKNIDWDECIGNMNTSQAWNTVEEKITEQMEKYIPKVRLTGPRSNRKPLWMDKNAFTKVRKKHQSFNRYKETLEGQVYDVYARARNQAKWECTKIKKQYEAKLAEEAKKNPKAFYKYARSKLKTKATVADLIKDDGTKTTSEKEKADALNEFFSSVFTKEDMERFPTFEERQVTSILENVNFTEEDVKKKLDKLKVDKSPGPDNLSPRVLKELSSELSYPLFLVFRKSLTESLLPQDWKKSHVTPIHKGGSKSKTSNYRPVSLTAIVCKIMESIVRDALMKHMKENNLLSNCQHGFIPGRSCVTQLLLMMDMWTRILDDHGTIDVTYLDFRKAFDTVPHERMLKKIEGYGIKGKVLSWIRAFLTGREQRVVVNGAYSKWSPVTSGIPQGSVLGPVLFVLFVNDMPDVVHSTLLMFADDAKVFRRVDSVEESKELQEDLNKLSEWADKWQMEFNIDKCKVMHIGYGNQKQRYSLPKDGQELELQKTTEEKDLGVIVDEKLNFSKHVEKKVNVANRILGLIRISYSNLTASSVRRLFKGLVRPHLEYAQTVWSPLWLKEARLIENVLQRAVKLIPECKKEKDDAKRLEKAKLPSMYYRRARGDMIEVYKFLHDKYQVDHKQLFERDTDPVTRGNGLKLKKPHCRLKLRAHSFGPRVINAWNKLPKEVVTAPSVNSFKNRLDKAWRKYLYAQQFIY